MKHSIRALPLALLLASGLASAVEPIEGQFTVTGTVPTESFSIIDPGNWMDKTQTIQVQGVGPEWGFQNFLEKILVKSTVGPIRAFLTEPPELVNGDTVLPLRVHIDGRPIAETPSQFINANDAAAGKLLEFRVGMASGHNPDYVAGDYAGSVSIVFETSPPL